MPRTFNSLAELIEALPDAVDRGLADAAEGIGFAIATRAREKLGTYQPGWPALAESTIRAHGGDDTPLLLTGHLGDTIQDTVDRRPQSYRVVVGSNAPQALVQEIGGQAGFAIIPPRPYLAPAVVESEDQIQQAVALCIKRAIETL